MQPDDTGGSARPAHERSYAPPPQSYGQAAASRPQYGSPELPTGRRVGIVALALALLGAALAAVGVLGVRWTTFVESDFVDNGVKFLRIREVAVALQDDGVGHQRYMTAYFSWAAFVLLGAALLVAIVSALPTAATPVCRVLGIVVGGVSAAAALFVPALDGTALSTYLKNGFGLYLVAGGSLLMGVGALIGSRRRV